MIISGRSLYARLVIRMGAVLGLSACALLFAVWFTTQLAVDEAYDRLLAGSALQIAENTYYKNGSVNVDVPLAAFSMLVPEDRVMYSVLGPDGRLIAGDPEFKPAIPWNKLESGPLVMDGVYQETPVRIAIIGRRMPVASGNPWAAIAIAQAKNSRSNFTASLAQKVLPVILQTGLLTAVAAMFTLFQALAPLKKIENAIRERDPNDLSPLDVVVPAETLAVVSSINGFMQRLAQHRALMRRLIGNAAHQLRTPVTAIISQADLLAREADETRRAHHLSRLQQRARALGELINQLISHAMVQQRAASVDFVQIDMTELVRHETAEMLSNYARAVDVALLAPDTPCLLRGDPVSLREAVKNVLANALKYGARSFLKVELKHVGERLECRFEEDGPGIPPPDWQRVREAFNARDGGREGASLGLSIVDEIVQKHGGSMRFEQGAGSFVVVLDFPAGLSAGLQATLQRNDHAKSAQVT